MHKMHNTHHMYQGHTSQHMRTLGSQQSHLVIFICKDSIAPGSVDYQLANVELRTLQLFHSVLIWIGTIYAKFKTFSTTVSC